MAKLPRFIVGFSHEDPDRDFVVHTQSPRFIAVDCSDEEDALEFEIVEWIDQAPEFEDEIQDVMDALGLAYQQTLEEAESDQ